ncbi:MAG: S8 family serine peptidase [Stenotrophomonas sp.]
MERKTMGRSVLASALAVALSACGGGGGGSNVRIDPPPTTPPVTPPVTPPPASKPLEPAVDAHLAQTNARAAQATGASGRGIRIGIVDSGVIRNAAALNGRVVANLNYIDGSRNNLNVDDVVGHGTAVASLAAGTAVGVWPGGIAPGAEIVSARIIADKAPVDDGSGRGNSFSGPLGVAGMHQDLIRYGVKVMNNSWGGLYWTDPGTTAQVAAEYRPFIIDNGGLVVFAAGNDGRDQPSSVAALPSQRGVGGSLPAADLERGWLVATAIDPNKPGQRVDWANACGDAMRYCLTAPGSAVFPEPGTDKYLWNYGTSFAAPLISGAAALVWERYPYFTNDLVRQTLLGTATDIGAPGVDAVFGYGMLDIGSAIKGPGRFDWGNTTVNVSQMGLNSVWSNNISGSGGLIKQGAGALGLSGTNTYTGDTRIEQGTLALRDGGSITSNVTILPPLGVAGSAALQFMPGTSRIKGNVDNGATVIVREANVNATIDGNYIQRAGSRLMISLGANPLNVTGTATLQGGVVHVDSIVSGYVAADGRTQTVLHANQGISGRFDGVTDNLTPGTLLETTLNHGSNDVTLTTDRVNVTLAASQARLNGTALASALRVETAFEQLDAGAGTTAFADGAGALQGVQGSQALQQSLESLSGKAHALAAAATFDSIDLSRRALSSRFGQVQGAPKLGGAWQNTLGDAGQGSFSASGTDTHGWMMGQDMPMGSNGVVGFAFGELRSHSNGSWGSDRGRDRQSQAQLYAGWSAGGAYALGQVGAGQFTREIDRQLLLGAGQYGVNARYGGSFSTASLESGYRFGSARAALTPYVGADYARVDNDRFSEQGGLGFGLRAQGSISSRSQALAGVRAERQWGSWSLRGYAEWQQLLSSQGLDVDASFVGVDAWAPMAGLQPTRSGGLFGLSVESWLSRNSRLAFGYDQRFGPRGELRQVALRYSAAF